MEKSTTGNFEKIALTLIHNSIPEAASQLSEKYNIPKEELINKLIAITGDSSLDKNGAQKKSKKGSLRTCIATVKNGDKCSRKRKDNSEYCGIHLRHMK